RTAFGGQDPGELLRLVLEPVGDDATPEDLDRHDQADAALEALLEATRTAFGVAPFDDGNGLTIAETVGLLTDFIEWLAAREADRPATPRTVVIPDPPVSAAG